jgi:protein involved in sex pheromone biosynthesis
MKNKVLIFLLSILFLSCNNTANKEQIDDNQTSEKQTELDTTKNVATDLNKASENEMWYDKLIADYIKNCDNELIKAQLNSKTRIEWLLDRTEKTDSTNYYIFNIGQDVFEEDGSNLRFTSNGWIYIDSISKKIYEYDLPNDSLIVWKNKHNR